VIEVSLARSAQEESLELAKCFRHEGEDRPRCNGSGFRPRKHCAGCGEHRSLMRNPADGLMYCLGCNPRFHL